MLRSTARFFFPGHATRQMMRRTALTFEQRARHNEQLEKITFEKTTIISQLIEAVTNPKRSISDLKQLLEEHKTKLTINDVCHMHVQLLRYNATGDNHDLAYRMEIVEAVIDRAQEVKNRHGLRR